VKKQRRGFLLSGNPKFEPAASVTAEAVELLCRELEFTISILEKVKWGEDFENDMFLGGEEGVAVVIIISFV
jgi:hypothetical protein